MRVILDTCVLVPNATREIVLRAAEQDLFVPLWSDKIFEEWKFVIAKNSSKSLETVKIEILLMNKRWNGSLVFRNKHLENTLCLPDMDDRHVLASAITGGAQIILTNNLKDFPPRLLATHGIRPRSVDSLFFELFYDFPDTIETIVRKVFHLSVEENNFRGQSLKSFLKKHGLPRLAKRVRL